MNCHYPFELPPLPYPVNALEPYLSAQILTLHHDKHFKTYVDGLNRSLEKYPAYHNWPIQRLIRENCRLPFQIQTAVWNNAGGVYNHCLYFDSLAPRGSANLSGALESAVCSAFGSQEKLLARLKECALSVFGSGYAWLACTGRGCLKIITTPNQDTPYPCQLRPLLNIDVWEHAYYLQYQNRRADYLDNLFQILNWDAVEKNYLSCFPCRSRRTQGPPIPVQEHAPDNGGRRPQTAK